MRPRAIDDADAVFAHDLAISGRHRLHAHWRKNDARKSRLQRQLLHRAETTHFATAALFRVALTKVLCVRCVSERADDHVGVAQNSYPHRQWHRQLVPCRFVVIRVVSQSRLVFGAFVLRRTAETHNSHSKQQRIEKESPARTDHDATV